MQNTIINHRSIRKYKSTAIEDALLIKVLEAATRASNTGNMQLYSIIVTREEDIKKKMLPLHFNQAMVMQAPVHLTFCADINRFHKWCEQRDTTPCYDNFLWFMNAATDAILASQNACIAAEANGLGICYLGTIIYNAPEFINLLSLPKGVIPVAAIVMGYPDDESTLTDRLPLEAIIHFEKYKDYLNTDINKYFEEKEKSNLTKELLKTNNKKTLAQVFTENRYKISDNVFFSDKLLNLLKSQGFI